MINNELKIVKSIINDFTKLFPGVPYKYIFKKLNGIHFIQVCLNINFNQEKFADFYIKPLEDFNRLKSDNMLCIVTNDTIIDFSFPDYFSTNISSIPVKDFFQEELIELDNTIEYAA